MLAEPRTTPTLVNIFKIKEFCKIFPIYKLNQSRNCHRTSFILVKLIN